MSLILYNFEFFSIYFVGFSYCILDNEPWESVFPDGDPWDVESSEEDQNISDVFSQFGEGEVLITSHTSPTWFMIPIISIPNEMHSDIPNQASNDLVTTSATDEVVGQSTGLNRETLIDTNPQYSAIDEILSSKQFKTRNKGKLRFVTLGNRDKTKGKLHHTFTALKPAKVYSDNMSQLELEIKFISQGDNHSWKELKDYPLESYARYWGYVCDYFSEKEESYNRYRGCYVSMSLLPLLKIRIFYFQKRNLFTRVELLRCRCYYYITDTNKPDSHEPEYAVHKYSDNEYFRLDKQGHYRYSVRDFLIEAFLPTPM